MSNRPSSDEPTASTELLGLLRRLMSCSQVEEQYDLVVSTLSEYLHAHIELWLSDTLWRLPVLQAPRRVIAPPSDLMQRAIEAGHIVTAEPPLPPGGRTVALPLIVRDHVLGALQIQWETQQPPAPELFALIGPIGDQIALALAATHQWQVQQWRSEQLVLVRRVNTQIASVLDLDQLASRVTELIQYTFRYYYVALFILDAEQGIVRLLASAGPTPPDTENLGAPTLPTIHLGYGIVGHVAETGVEIVADDVNQEPNYRYVETLPRTRAEVTLPLKFEDRVLGVLDVQSDRPHALHEVDLLVLRTLAESIAVAIENAQMYQNMRRRAEQISVIAEVNRAAASILDQEALLGRVAELIQQQFGYPAVHLFTVDPVQDRVVLQVGRGQSTAALDRDLSFRLDDDRDIIPWVASRGETVLENDIGSDPRFGTSSLRSSDTRSELAVPLVFNGQVLGVLDVQSDRPDAFGMDDYFMFRTVSDSIATALRNANLYRSERWRRQVADSMREVAGLLSSEVLLEEILNAILVELDRTLPCDLAAICLLEEDELTIAASRSQGSELNIDMFAKDDNAWIARALYADQPLIRSPDMPTDPIAASLALPADYSAIAASLHAGGHHLGLLYLAHHSSRRYGSESEVLMAAFASYAAVAIENARIYYASQEQALISVVMLQVAEATQSLTVLDEVLQTVVRLIVRLVGISRCAILLWDAAGARFVPAVAHGLTAGQQAAFESWHLNLDHLQPFDELLLTKSPLVIHDVNADERTAEHILSLLGFESLLALPLLAQGDVLGALLVDYRDDMISYDTARTVRDEQLAIIQGIAHQTAAAIENIQLREAQQEEAYVSAALLQVAQTVASLSDIDDILGAIVRITPILVGVDRCLLFLRDEPQQAFRASHVYGLARRTEAALLARSYRFGEFGLLDTVLDDGMFSYTFDQTAMSTTAYLPPDFVDWMGYGQPESRSLLGFPLSVKGDVLGVMVLEETNSQGQMREHRLEIITGIAQQAALALQNEQLQLARLERERLEGELQLAREIQQTFIPERLPQPQGWELAASWHAARQVAGDFYDLIELPDGKLGILIADVADKGMPAALFMTLTRSLLRAATRDKESPAHVLAQVNDLLVPDTRRGMFVTAFYAVLCPERGRLTYANAGHNAPLALRARSGQLVSLGKGEMALGVMPGIRFREHTMRLFPGDSVIMYTDGITEAISPRNEFFGKRRLYQVVRRAESASAQALLDRINYAVHAHLDTAPASDDITVVVLHRQQEPPRSEPAAGQADNI